MNELTTEQRAYLAGFFDGEGCIHLFRIKRRGKVGGWAQIITMGNTYLPVLEWAHSITGIGRLTSIGSETTHRWEINRKPEAIWFLEQIYDFVIVKKDQIRVVQEFWSLGGVAGHYLSPEATTRREELNEQLKQLKKVRFTRQYNGG